MSEELFRVNAYLKECEATVTAVIGDGACVDRTVFYPAGGGQPGDTGVMRASGGELRVVDTRKDAEGNHLHLLAPGVAPPVVGERVSMRIDWERRHRLMRMHSCMHMLCAAVPAGVTGGSIGEDRGRLDFDLQETLDKQELTERLNALIAGDHPMRLEWVEESELDANPDLVRTLSVQPPRGFGSVRLVRFEGVDVQPCGGTHVASSAEIGRVRVEKIEKKGKRNRRVIVVFDE